MHISGMALLYLLRFLGVIYVRINQMYCSHFKQVLIVFDCALMHALSHSPIEIFSCRSFVHASSLFTDVSVHLSSRHFYILEIKPLSKQFMVIKFKPMGFINTCSKEFTCCLMTWTAALHPAIRCSTS